MNPIYYFVLFVGCIALSYGLLRLLLLKSYGLLTMDVPNIRSLHNAPVPRGGGLVIVLIILVACIGLQLVVPESVVPPLWIALLVTVTGVIGWLDDFKDLSVLLRIILQLSCAIILLTLFDLPHSIYVGGARYSLNVDSALVNACVYLFLIVWMVWMTNLFNFMDGVDGLVMVQALVAALTLALWFGSRESNVLLVLNLCLAGGILGFGLLNWHPAKIFLGDVGSLALGSYFGLMAIIGWIQYQISFDVFILLYGLFFFDATITLLRRMLSRQRWWEAHTSHFYQRAYRLGYNHRQITIMATVICLVLAALSSASFYSNRYAFVWTLGSIIVLASCGTVIKIKEKQVTASRN